MNLPAEISRFAKKLIQVRKILTRGRRFFVFRGFLYRESPALTREFRQEIIDADLDRLAHGNVFLRFPGSFRRRTRTEDMALLAQGFGRFGNMVIQLGNLFLLSCRLGITNLYFWESPYLRKRYAPVGGIQLERGRALPEPGRSAPAVIFRTRAFSGPSFPDDIPRDLSEALRKLIAESVLRDNQSAEVSTKKCLVIHLRSGDIFWTNPHPDYGQPPLSFYWKVLTFQSWDEVLLLSEDDANPCYEGIVGFCETLDIPVKESGRELRRSFQEIMLSEYIVFSTGTFCPALCWLSSSPRTVFYFGTDPPTTFPLQDTRFVLFHDASGVYVSSVMSGNWKNSTSQRALMLEYPAESLGGPAIVEGTFSHRE